MAERLVANPLAGSLERHPPLPGPLAFHRSLPGYAAGPLVDAPAAVEALGVERVETKVYAYNTLSVNSLKRNGFTLEGTLRQARMHGGRRWDILVFSALEPEIRDELAGDGFPPMGFWSVAVDEPADTAPAPPDLASASA